MEYLITFLAGFQIGLITAFSITMFIFSRYFKEE